MRKVLAWLGAATVFVTLTANSQAASDTLKPYVVLILDTSGSMSSATGSGPTSCGKPDSRINHAVCAINNIVNSYGDMVFGFARFRETPGGATTAGTCPTGCSTNGVSCADCNPAVGTGQTCTQNSDCNGADTCVGIPAETGAQCNNNIDDDGDGKVNDGCPAVGAPETNSRCNNNTDDDGDGFVNDGCPAVGNGICTGTSACHTEDSLFELLAPLVDGNNSSTALFTNGTCNECSLATGGANDPEIWGVGSYTPLGAVFAGDKRYWQGLQATDATVIWPGNQAGFDPINRDPSNAVFLAQVGHCSTTTTLSCYNNTNCPTPQTCIGGTGTQQCDSNSGTCNAAVGCVGATCCCTSQCRPYITIMLTDGDETCTSVANVLTNIDSLLNTTPHNDAVLIASVGNSGAVRTATSLVTITTQATHPFKVGDTVVITAVGNATFNGTFQVTTVGNTAIGTCTTAPCSFTYQQASGGAATSGGGNAAHVGSLNRYRIQTKPIGFGTGVGYQPIEDMAHHGGAVDVPNVNEGYYANDEAGLELAISQIIEGSIRHELCNNADDDCDLNIDEDFPTKGNACNNGKPGYCLVNGTLACNQAQTGVACTAGTAACLNLADGTGCTVTNAAGASVAGTCTTGVCNPTPLADGAFAAVGAPETGAQCLNNIDDDGDGVINDGCPHEAVCGDGIDNDCDGKVDEGCTTCVPTGEICDGMDNDCDNIIDEGITRACGTGSCQGVETCNYFADPSHYTGCTAQVPTAEICDGLDNNCDGTADGFDLACSNVGRCSLGGTCSNSPSTVCTTNVMCGAGNHCDIIICKNNTDCGIAGTCNAVAGGPATQNPGDASHSPIPENICHPGTKNCPVAPPGNGTFQACLGEVLPQATDGCDGVDNDCDNVIDEDFVPANCSSNCGVGQTQCIAGVISCNAQPSTVDNTCDGVDDDCDGKIDEDWVCSSAANCAALGNCCSCGTGTTCEQNKCVNGAVTCVATQTISPEQCNCVDDDCDGTTDEGSLCPGGATCTNCQCAFACSPGEFPCPLGKKCQNAFCVNDPCYGVTCPSVGGVGRTCVDDGMNNGVCVDICTTVTCSAPLACFPPTGECLPDDCSTYPNSCTADQNCINGNCVTNLCQGVTCPGDQYCVAGQCYGSCADVTCPTGQRCRLGSCEADPCGHACPFGEACNDSTGHCIADPCTFRNCPTGQWCNPNDGQCEDDPCVGTKCPAQGQICRGGSCFDPLMFQPDAGEETHVTVGGGGCDAGGGGTSGAGLMLAMAALLVRRRRAAGGAQ